MKKAIIIGSGPTGLGAAFGLDNECTVLEAGSDIGGYSASIEIDGAVFDYGGHSFHTPHPEVKELVFNALEMYEQTRNAKCLINGQIIPYPFQKHYKQIDNDVIVKECESGLMALSSDKQEADNFEEFIASRFGEGISKHFMIPYNRKLWGRDLKKLTTNWTGERVAAPNGVKEKFNTKGGVRKPLQSDTKVAYPAKGGFGEIWKSLGRNVNEISFDTRVVKIDPKDRKVYTSENHWVMYDNLISTMPVTKLLPMIEGCPQELIASANELESLALTLGLVVIDHPVDTDIQRIYSAEDHIPSHKTAVNHNSSDYLRQRPKHGIMMEISSGPEKPVLRADTEQWIKDSLEEMQLVKSRSEISKVQIVNTQFAYPVPTHNKQQIIRQIKDWLNEQRIWTVGRFGEWAYINSDESFHRGFALGRNLLSS